MSLYREAHRKGGRSVTQILELNGKPVTNFKNPDRKVKWSKLSIYSHTVYGSLRSIAHLDDTSKRAEQAHGHEVEIIQGAYNTTIAASAGTHDYDACYDVFIPMTDWSESQRFFRAQGWGAWWRYPPIMSNHIHMISLGYTTRVGTYVPGQVQDYYAHRDGMAGHGPDNTWHPEDIRSTIFDFEDWANKQEEDMPLSEHDLRQIRQIVHEESQQVIEKAIPDIAAKVMNETVNKDGDTTRAALRAAKATPGLIKDLGDGSTPAVKIQVPE